MIYTESYLNCIKKCVKSIPNINKIYNKTIAIIGANGLIGSAVIDILLWMNKCDEAKIKIIAIGRDLERVNNRFKSFIDENEILFVDYKSFERELNINRIQVDMFVYAAGYANPNYYLTNPIDVIEVNYSGMSRLLKYVCQSNARVVYVSSSEVYGIVESSKSITECEVGRVDFNEIRSCYPEVKRLTELLCKSYAYEKNVDVSIVRPGHIYGPMIIKGDNKASSQFAIAAKEKKDIILKSDGLQMRSYCFATDCASAIITVLLNGIKGEKYNIGNKLSNVSIRAMAEMYASVAGVSVVYDKPSDKEKKSFNQMKNSGLNVDKLESLGWSANVDIETGIRITLDGLNL